MTGKDAAGVTGQQAAAAKAQGVTGQEAAGEKPQRVAAAGKPERVAPAGAAVGGSPIRRLGGTIGRLPRYLVLARNLLRDPGLSRWRKAGLAASLAYVASPIDLVPGLIPVAGQLDDLAALLLGLRAALRGFTTEAAEAHLIAAGLKPGDPGRDLAIVRAAAGWIAGRVGSASLKVGRTSIKAGGKLLGMAARGAGRLAASAARRARRAARPEP